MKNAGFFEGGFGKYVLPGIILQSVLIGGGFATGREIVEFGAKYGALGWIGGVGVFIGFTVLAALTFEFARVFKTYDYRSFLSQLIGKGWIIYDVVYVLLSILILAVMSAATGEILNTTLGLNYWVGVILIAVIVGFLNFFGSSVIERFKSIGTVMLFLAYILFAVLVIYKFGDNISNVFETNDSSYDRDGTSISAVLLSGILYIGYNLGVFPAALFTVRRQQSSKHTMIAGLVAGLLMCVPWFLTYFSLLAFYPNEEVLGATVPWLQMLQSFDRYVIIIFGLVVGWTLVETSTGIIHALIDRINAQMEERSSKGLTKKQKGIIAIATLALAVLFAQFGIIDLIAKGYTIMAYCMIGVFALPLMTIGVWKIMKAAKGN